MRLGITDGTLPPIGDDEPFVAATAIMPPHPAPSDVPPGPAGRTYRPRTVHNGEAEATHQEAGPNGGPRTSKGDETR